MDSSSSSENPNATATRYAATSAPTFGNDSASASRPMNGLSSSGSPCRHGAPVEA